MLVLLSLIGDFGHFPVSIRYAMLVPPILFMLVELLLFLKLGLWAELVPKVYAALHIIIWAALMMLLLGTSPEQFEAVWVKNEWSRYLERMNADPSCRLVPLYKNMRPEELPSQIKGFQAVSMERIGFEQEVTDIVGRLAGKKQNVEAAVTLENIRKRGYPELEKGDYANANKLFEDALLHAPEDWESYLGKLLCRYKRKSMEEVLAITPPVDFRSEGDYRMLRRFAAG